MTNVSRDSVEGDKNSDSHRGELDDGDREASVARILLQNGGVAEYVQKRG